MGFALKNNAVFWKVFMIAGLFTRYASTFVALTVVTTFVVHKGIILNIPALYYIWARSVFIVVGRGKFSMDNKFFNKYLIV